MKRIESPADLAKYLTGLFPAFAVELEDEEIDTYHHIVFLLAPRITSYLESSPERTIKAFCKLVDTMVDAGGETESAISTCLLEHASQVGVRKIIRAHLGPAAKRELR